MQCKRFKKVNFVDGEKSYDKSIKLFRLQYSFFF